MKPSTNRRRSASLAVAAAAVATALSACGSGGMMHDGTVAGSYDGHSVSNSDVQTAVKQLATAYRGFDTGSATEAILLLPKLETLGHKYNVAISAAQARSKFPPSTHPGAAAIKAARSNEILSSLPPTAQKDAVKLIQHADIKLNPRYGQLVDGKLVASSPWIKQVTDKSQAPTG